MLADPRILTFCLAYFGVEISLYGVILWLPQIFRAAAVPPTMVSYAGAAEGAGGQSARIPV